MDTRRISKPVLYYDCRSPPVRSCLMLIQLLNIDLYKIKVDLFKGEQYSNEFKKINPAHTVPVLIDDDITLTDSHNILIHLCECFQNNSAWKDLWPMTNYKERMRILNLLLFEATVLFRRDSQCISDIIRNGYNNADIAYHRKQVYDAYDTLEQYLRKTTFVATNNLTIADLSIVTTLSTIDMLFPVIQNQCPKLLNWFHYMKNVDVYQINDHGLEELRSILLSVNGLKLPIEEINRT